MLVDAIGLLQISNAQDFFPILTAINCLFFLYHSKSNYCVLSLTKHFSICCLWLFCLIKQPESGVNVGDEISKTYVCQNAQ